MLLEVQARTGINIDLTCRSTVHEGLRCGGRHMVAFYKRVAPIKFLWRTRQEEPMAEMEGTIRVRVDDRTLAFKVVGRGTMLQSPAVRQLAEQSLTPQTTRVHIDLRHCTYIDSTFQGTLLLLKRLVERRGEGEFALVSPSPQCRRLLAQIGFDQILPIVEAEEPDTRGWAELRTAEEKDLDLFQFKQSVVQAHQELAHLSGPTGERYRALAAMLTQEWESETRGK